MKKTLLSLLMVLPLIACTPAKGKDEPTPGPGPGPGPDTKEVRRSELYASFVEIGKAVTGDNSFAFDSEYDTYEDDGDDHYYATDIYEGTKSEGMTWETALNDFTKELPSKYTRVFAPREFTWEDGDKGLETAYTLGDTIYVSMATWEDSEDTSIYVSYAVMPNEGVTFVDDGDPIINDGPKEQTVTFNFTSGEFTGSLDLDNSRGDFVTWMNTKDDIVESCDIVEGGYAQVNDVSGTKSEPIYTLVLGSGKKTCDFTFNFKYAITKITMNVQAYTKYDSYNNVWRNDANSTLGINGTTDVVDLSNTITDGPTEVKNVERTYTKETNQKTFELIANTGRVFVNSMTVTYVK